MLAARVVLQLPLMALGPLLCHFRGHHWHRFAQHACSPVRVCDRCGFIVHDPYRTKET